MCLAAGIAIFALTWSRPLNGDAVGYGYTSARWMCENGMSPIPAGTERGEQALGHPAWYFWLWALLMKLFGDRLWVAHILPSVSSAAALMGAWMLGRSLGGRSAGAWSAACLLFSPLFIAQSTQPLQDMPFAALAALSLAGYAEGRPGRAMVLCAGAVLLREQAILLALSYLAVELAAGGRWRIRRALLLSLPFLVMAAHLLGNLLVNGHLVNEGYAGEPPGMPPGWLLSRVRLFAGHLLAENGRWVLVTVAIAAALSRFSTNRLSTASVLVLLAPAALWPPARLAALAALAAGAILALLRAGRLPGPAGLAVGTFMAAMVSFHVLVVKLTSDPQLDLLRYMLAAYPAFLAACLAVIRHSGGVRLLNAMGLTAVLLSIPGSFEAPGQTNRDRNIRGMASADWMREAVAVATATCDTVVVPESEILFLERPGLGYVREPRPARTLLEGGRLSPGGSYAVIIPPDQHFEGEFRRFLTEAVPEGCRLDTIAAWADGWSRVTLLATTPSR